VILACIGVKRNQHFPSAFFSQHVTMLKFQLSSWSPEFGWIWFWSTAALHFWICNLGNILPISYRESWARISIPRTATWKLCFSFTLRTFKETICPFETNQELSIKRAHTIEPKLPTRYRYYVTRMAHSNGHNTAQNFTLLYSIFGLKIFLKKSLSFSFRKSP